MAVVIGVSHINGLHACRAHPVEARHWFPQLRRQPDTPMALMGTHTSQTLHLPAPQARCGCSGICCRRKTVAAGARARSGRQGAGVNRIRG
jgi:hypothetical protein